MSVEDKSPDHVPAAPTPEVRKAIRSLLDYNWSGEQEHYLETLREDPDVVAGHVFINMVAVDNWLCGTSFTPDDYLKEDDE